MIYLPFDLPGIYCVFLWKWLKDSHVGVQKQTEIVALWNGAPHCCDGGNEHMVKERWTPPELILTPRFNVSTLILSIMMGGKQPPNVTPHPPPHRPHTILSRRREWRCLIKVPETSDRPEGSPPNKTVTPGGTTAGEQLGFVLWWINQNHQL